jgi:hypothetical protein
LSPPQDIINTIARLHTATAAMKRLRKLFCFITATPSQGGRV